LVILYLLSDKKEALSEDEGAREIVDDTHEDVGPLLLVKRGKVGTVKRSDRSTYFVHKEGRNLPGVAFPDQHSHHLVSV
jgi:hypothetical protein